MKIEINEDNVQDDALSMNSFNSVIKVSDEQQLEQNKPDNDSQQEDQAVTELTLSVPQFEVMLSELKTKHIAEKRMLQCDLSLCKKVI